MERIDDLQVNGLKIIQDDQFFCFGCDSVELANFVTGFKRDFAIDLGAGNGIISILLAGKKGIKTTAVEIDNNLCNLARRNAKLNNLDSMVDVLNMRVQDLKTAFKSGERTIVVSNPPYFKVNSGAASNKNRGFARHEIFLTQGELVEAASYLLSDGGRFFVVYPIGRMAELMSECRNHKLEPKECVILHSEGKEPHLFLLKCVKGGRVGLKVSCRRIKDYGME